MKSRKKVKGLFGRAGGDEMPAFGGKGGMGGKKKPKKGKAGMTKRGGY